MRWRFALLLLLVGCRPEVAPVPEPPDCTVAPRELDFGEVESGRRATAQVVLTNHSRRERRLNLSPVAAPFFLDFFSRRAIVAPNGAVVLQLFFQPNHGLRHLDEFVITEEDPRPETGACDFRIQLRGLGKGQLAIEEPTVDFGQLEPGDVATRELRVHNSRREAVTLAGDLQVVQELSRGQPFVTLEPATMVVPALGTASFTLTAAPEAPGLVEGVVSFSASEALSGLPINSRLFASFSARAGKPVVEVSSPTLSPWRVGYSPGSLPWSFSNRRLTVRNVGTSGAIDQLALRTGLPAYLVEPVHGSFEELSIDLPQALFAGLAQGDSAELGLRLVPNSLGPKEFNVRLFLNDPARPVVDLQVRATAEALHPCTMTVRPNNRIELTRAGDRLEGRVSFTNSGSTLCILDDLHLGAATLPGFTISEGRADQVELAPGATHSVTVEGPPQVMSGVRVGTLEFHVFNEGSDTEFVPFYAP